MNEALGFVPPEIKQAFWNQLTHSVNEGNNNLLPLSVYMLCKRLMHMHDVGVKQVAVDQIRGSVGLSLDFDTSYMPRQPHIRNEWTSADQARFQNAALPLIDLLKIGEMYFVLGACSLSSLQSQDAVQAHVVEVQEDIC